MSRKAQVEGQILGPPQLRDKVVLHSEGKHSTGCRGVHRHDSSSHGGLARHELVRLLSQTLMVSKQRSVLAAFHSLEQLARLVDRLHRQWQ